MRLLTLGLLLSTALFAGCTGGGDDGPGYAAVSGVVTLDGNPVEGATVNFIPKGAGTLSMALTDANGNFKLRTATGKVGAAIGDHSVTVTLVEQPPNTQVATDDGLAPAMPNEMGTAPGRAAAPAAKPLWLVPQKYSTPETSALTATVTSSGLSDHKLELTTK